MLFDDKETTFHGSPSHVEGQWEYLDRSARIEARRVREFLEQWVAQYPKEHRDELVARMQSGDDRQFHSATFEILLFATLRRLGCDVIVHPDLPGEKNAHPDFLAHVSDDVQVYVEAVLASEFSAAEIAAQKRKNVVFDAIEKVDSPNFYVGIDAEGNPEKPPAGKALRAELEKWLKSLDPDAIAAALREVGSDALPTKKWDQDGWQITFEAFPRRPERRGTAGRVIGALAHGVRYVNVWEPIRDAVKTKGNKYGELPHPLLICVNVDGHSVERIDAMQALFGQEEYLFGSGRAEPEMRRRPNGAWSGPKGLQYKRVSGAWVFGGLNAWNVASSESCVYFNPWAEKQLPELFTKLHHAKVNEEKMCWADGVDLHELLGLTREWPE